MDRVQSGYARYDAPRTARRRGRRRHRRAGAVRLLFILLIAAALLTVFRSAGGFSEFNLFGIGKAPTNNIERDFNVDLGELSKRYTADMKGFSPSQDDLDSLRETADKYPQYRDKIDFFIDHVGAYDKTAVNTVILAPEKVDFVLLCPFEGDTPSGDWGVKVKKGTVPYFIQYDSRWAFHRYGSSGMGNTACGPTCLAMAAAGLTGNGGYTPDAVADYAYDNGYYVNGAGTSWELFTSGAAAFGIKGEPLSADEGDMKSSLGDGDVLIASLTPGDFTRAGHFIVIYGAGPGGFSVYDPSSVEHSDRTWSFERLKPQIAQLWRMSEA